MKFPSLFKNKNYLKVFSAGSLSELGSFVTDTVLFMHIYQISNQDKFYLGANRSVFIALLVLGSLIGSPFAEKHSKKKVLLWTEILRVPLVIVLMLASHSLYMLILCNGMIAFFTGVFKPTRQAYFAEVVSREDIKKANSYYSSSMAIIHMGAPLIGALIYEATKSTIPTLIFDLSTYLLAFVLLLSISESFSKKSVNKSTVKVELLKDLKEAFLYIRSRSDLMALTGNIAITGLCIGVLIPLILPFTTEILKGTQAEYGYLMACFGVGGILGGVLSSQLVKQFRPGQLASVTTFLEAVMFLIWIHGNSILACSILILIWGILVFIRIPSQWNYLTLSTPHELLARLSAFLEISFFIPNILGALTITILSNSFTTYQILLFTGVFFLFTMSFRAFGKGFKELYLTNT